MIELPSTATALATLGGAALAHVALRRAARRLPRWPAARRGIHAGGGRAPGETAFALACFGARLAVWLVAFRVLAARYWIIQGLRYRAEQLIGMSIEAPLFALGERTTRPRSSAR